MMHEKKDCTLINIVTKSGIAATAKIVEELPPVGSVWENDIVAELIPAPLRDHQPDMNAFGYAIWQVKREHKLRVCFVAVSEPDAEAM